MENGENIHKDHREKMKRRFLASSLDSFAEHEALELLLYFSIPRRDTNLPAHKLIERYGSLARVFAAPVEDLKQVEGVGEASALLIHLVRELWSKARSQEREVILNSTRLLGDFLLQKYRDISRETVFQLCLDRKGKLLTCKQVGEGGVSAAYLDVRQVVENAIISSASMVVLAHNHPSGVAMPSEDDYAVTGRLKSALELIGIPLIDHIVLADGDFVSMRESGYL